MKKFLSIFCVLVGLACFHPALAVLWAPISLPRLVSHAELVVRGRVLRVEKAEGNHKRGFVQVDRVLKGSSPEGIIEIDFMSPTSTGSMNDLFIDTLIPQDYDLFFLKREGNLFVAFDPRHLKFPVREGNPVIVSANSDTLEVVRSDLLWSLTPEAVFSVEDQKKLTNTQIKDDLRAAYRVGAVPLNVRVVEQLQFFPPDLVTINQMKELLSSLKLDVDFRGKIIESLLNLNQPEALQSAVEYIERNASAPENSDLSLTLYKIESSISRQRNPKAFPKLLPLVSHPNAMVRASAIMAISTIILELKYPTTMGVDAVSPISSTAPQTDSKKEQLTARQAAYQVVPRLIPLLDDPDTQVRFQTILALTEITSQRGKGPGYDPLGKNYKRSDEEPYIAYWKGWWTEQLLKAKGMAGGANGTQLPGAAQAALLPRAEDDHQSLIGQPLPTFKVGQAAPDFQVMDAHGNPWHLSALRGQKNVLLTFFPKCFTGGCATQLSSLRDHQKEFDATQTQIMAVSVDPAEGEQGQLAFAKQWGFQFPLIPDPKRQLGKQFGAVQNDDERAARLSFLIDKSGIVRWIDTDVHVGTHGADVLAKIHELGLER